MTPSVPPCHPLLMDSLLMALCGKKANRLPGLLSTSQDWLVFIVMSRLYLFIPLHSFVIHGDGLHWFCHVIDMVYWLDLNPSLGQEHMGVTDPIGNLTSAISALKVSRSSSHNDAISTLKELENGPKKCSSHHHAIWRQQNGKETSEACSKSI